MVVLKYLHGLPCEFRVANAVWAKLIDLAETDLRLSPFFMQPVQDFFRALDFDGQRPLLKEAQGFTGIASGQCRDAGERVRADFGGVGDRKSPRLNSSH